MIYLALVSTFIMGDTKGSVARAREIVLQSPSKGEASILLVKALWLDQDQEGAFRLFLETVEKEPFTSAATMSENEAVVYQEALDLYLSQRPEEAKATARKIIDNYLPILNAHPDWYQLGFVVALAQANFSDFEPFFDLFYRSYKHHPKHFLAMKTRAILHIKLFERSKTLGDKELQRKQILDLLDQAEAMFSYDMSIYRLEITFSSVEGKDETKRRILNKILTLSMIPSRADTLDFVKLALGSNSKDLAERWITQAKKWYPNSRTLKQLEENGYQNAR